MNDEKRDELEAEEKEKLVAENAELRESAESFGALMNGSVRRGKLNDGSVCPRCNRPQHVVRTPPTPRGDDLHCRYCGHSRGSQATVGNRAEKE